jgi:hypothetical protein
LREAVTGRAGKRRAAAIGPCLFHLAVIASVGISICAQDPAPPVFTYTGKPITLPMQCTIDDMQWAGLSCTEDDPCPMYLELSVLDSVGSKIFAGGNIHSQSVTIFSVFLGSDDGGQTWREVHPRIRGAGLDRIQFFDSDAGWVSGEVLSPLPQDPFVLVTSDGGKTWRQRPIFSETRESRYGMVQQFFFSTKSNGSLIVDRGQGSDGDRYELYESPDGGDSWSIRETSNKPMQIRKAPATGAGDWRLRADRASQSFHIEHRQGDRWSNVAAFAVKLNACKPPVAVEENPAPAPVKK